MESNNEETRFIIELMDRLSQELHENVTTNEIDTELENDPQNLYIEKIVQCNYMEALKMLLKFRKETQYCATRKSTIERVIRDCFYYCCVYEKKEMLQYALRETKFSYEILLSRILSKQTDIKTFIIILKFTNCSENAFYFLEQACKYNREDIVQWILSKETDSRWSSNFGLLESSKNGNIKLVNLLLKRYDNDVEFVNFRLTQNAYYNFDEAIYEAYIRKHEDVVRVIISYLINLSNCDLLPTTFTLLVKKNNIKLLQLFDEITNGSMRQTNWWIKATHKCSDKLVFKWLFLNDDYNMLDPHCAISWAISENDIELVNCAIKRGANILTSDILNNWRKINLDMLKFLLENTEDKSVYKCLFELQDDPQFIELALKMGVEITISQINLQCVNYLLNAGVPEKHLAENPWLKYTDYLRKERQKIQRNTLKEYLPLDLISYCINKYTSY